VAARTLKLATYNIHRCVGLDGKYNPHRVIEVLNELDADVVGLQEIDSHHVTEEGHQLNYIIKNTNYHVVASPTLVRADAHYGNALLSRFEFKRIWKIDLTIDGLEPRAAIDAEIDIGGETLRIVSTHLGLKRAERRRQMENLMKNVGLTPKSHVVLMGDFNEWIPFFGSTKILRGNFRRRGLWGSFPAPLPVFRLDEIYVHPKKQLKRTYVHKTDLSRVASDHLPVVAEIKI
jgi:endonuclease/exonuclease/phosphatase family metal-dependent hydrolase